MEAYKTWVRRNKDYVHSLQSLANGLTWLLPERFSNSEIDPEAVTATLGTLTAINEHIIDTAPEESHTGLADPLSFPYGLYISALKDLGTLVEVVAEQYYGDKRWNFIAVRKLPRETPDVGKILMIQVYNIKLGASLLSRFGESARMISDPLWVQRSKQQHAIMKPQSKKREPFFNKYTKQTFENTEKLLEPAPLIGTLAEKIVELVVGAQTRYTYVWILKSEAASIHGSRQ